MGRSTGTVAYGIGILLILSGLIHLGVILVTGGSWEGPLSMRKPTTFGLSFGLTLINVTLLASLLPLSDRLHRRLIGTFAAACVIETFLVSMQAWRGVPSHFNMSTPFDTVVAQALAIGGFTLVVCIVMLTIAALRKGGALPAPMRLALRAGLVALVGAQVTGGLMIATGVRYVIAGDPQRAYAIGGWLKPVHGVLMHSILMLPLLAWWVVRHDAEPRRQMRAMRAGITVYALIVMAALASVFLA